MNEPELDVTGSKLVCRSRDPLPERIELDLAA